MFWIILVFLCIIAAIQFTYICNFKKQIKEILNILDDISDGNLNRRLLTNKNSILCEVVYKMNDIVIQNKEKILEKDRSEKVYKKLVTSLSHDLRTPLASLIGYLEVLENKPVTPQEQKHFLKTAMTKALHLSDYIQTLFEWLKLESGEWFYELENQNICELTRLILADWVIKLEENNIKYQFEIPEETINLMIDKNAFSRILNNLLTNIIRHSHATHLTIKVRNTENKLKLSITDNGIGISEKDLPFVFDRLYKCDTSRTENSNGLGLAIAKELTNALNGTITVKSCFGKGTTFQLTFPESIKKT